MARTFTPIDGKVVMQSLVKQATGQESIKITDLSSYVSAGETVLATGMENVFNSLNVLIGRTIIAARSSKEELSIIQAQNTGAYTNRFRKISYYSKNPKHSGFFNTDLYTNLADGYTAGQNDGKSTKSQWEQNPPMPFEMNFGGSTAWDFCVTQYEDQIKAPFRSPDEMSRFIAGYMMEHSNDIIRTKNAFNRMNLLARIGSTYHYGTTGAAVGAAVNLTEGFNSFYGTNYTSEQLRSVHLKEFLAYMTATIKEYIDFLTEDSVKYHLAMEKRVDGEEYAIIRKTAKEDQRLVLYKPLFRKAESLVLPEIFRPEYLDLETQYEGVSYWQSNTEDDNRAAIKINVPIFNRTSGVQEKSPDIDIPYVVGILFDRDSVMTDYQLERAYTTPVEARKGYRNTWLHIAKNAINDPTENAIVFYMKDGD